MQINREYDFGDFLGSVDECGDQSVVEYPNRLAHLWREVMYYFIIRAACHRSNHLYLYTRDDHDRKVVTDFCQNLKRKDMIPERTVIQVYNTVWVDLIANISFEADALVVMLGLGSNFETLFRECIKPTISMSPSTKYWFFMCDNEPEPSELVQYSKVRIKI